MNLNGQWKLYYYPCYERDISTVEELKAADVDSVSAVVPGNVELDLSAAGVLPDDLFKGMNLVKAEEYERHDWWYEKEFLAPHAPNDDQEVILAFGAVDCYAEYFLNGNKIGQSENMFIAQEFNVTSLLRYGEKNEIHVHIRSAVVEASRHEIDADSLAYSWNWTKESLFARKAPHSYSWDIMPRAVSAGLWRDVKLEYRSKYRFRYTYIATEALSGDTATMALLYDVILPDEYYMQKFAVTITGVCGDHRFTATARRMGRSGKVTFYIPQARLWWPKHYGDPNLYDVHIEFASLDGRLVLTDDVMVGVRTIELRRSEIVEDGGCFEFVVNGERIMAVGSNWVPMDVYHSRDKSRYAKALALANDIGCNILRCWGGNVYEDHEFFDFCDANGIMVWQDFAMACHYYPQSEYFMNALRLEAEAVIKKLRIHPSLVLWSGDNEIDSMLAMTNNVDPSVNRLTREVLPHAVARHDPYRPFIASSPYISTQAFKSGDNRQGSTMYPEDHLWGPRDYFKSGMYRDSKAYFVSETGYMGCPARHSLEKYLDADYVWPYTDNDQWNYHSSGPVNWEELPCFDGRVMLMHNQVKQLFGEAPTQMDDYILASQISQAEAKKFFVERMRMNMARNGGVIWWNLIDGWPQESDAIVDYYYEKKLAYSYIKRSQTGFMMMMGELDSWVYPVVCCNSTLTVVEGICRVYDIDTNEVLTEGGFSVSPNSNLHFANIPMMYSERRMLVIEWIVNGKKSFNTHLCGYPPFDFEQYKGWLKKICVLEEENEDISK